MPVAFVMALAKMHIYLTPGSAGRKTELSIHLNLRLPSLSPSAGPKAQDIPATKRCFTAAS